MILVNSAKVTDYAILKQVQQIRLIDPTDHTLSVVSLDSQPDLSKVSLKETLFVVSHGRAGDFFGGVSKNVLISYLADSKYGVPKGFNGDILLLSCCGGDAPPGQSSLAKYVATMLTGRVAKGTMVAGATGYSFGTPEFRQSRRSSVLCASEFYSLGDINPMVAAWLKLQPTHGGGVLHDDLAINVDTGKTIKELLTTIPASQRTPEEIAAEYVVNFADEARRIEDALKGIVAGNTIPKSTIAEAADFLVTRNEEQVVQSWNAEIDNQYKLYTNLYLWKSRLDAFKAEHVL
jgi:hypothetical protein